MTNRHQNNGEREAMRRNEDKDQTCSVDENGRATVTGWCDQYLEPDPHYKRIFKMH